MVSRTCLVSVVGISGWLFDPVSSPIRMFTESVAQAPAACPWHVTALLG